MEAFEKVRVLSISQTEFGLCGGSRVKSLGLEHNLHTYQLKAS